MVMPYKPDVMLQHSVLSCVDLHTAPTHISPVLLFTHFSNITPSVLLFTYVSDVATHIIFSFLLHPYFSKFPSRSEAFLELFQHTEMRNINWAGIRAISCRGLCSACIS